MNQFNSVVFDTDSYKVSMWKQYPPGTEYVYSYITARVPSERKIVFFLLQQYIREVLSKRVTMEEVIAADAFWTAHGEPFNREGWEYIVKEHDGILPLMVRTLDEGLVVNGGTVLATIMNTDPKCYWLTTWVETGALRAAWYGTTVATNSYDIKQVIKDYLEKSGDVANLPFKLHDFGSRGVSSNESAVLGGMAHLVNFMGTDTAVALLGAERWYDAKPGTIGFSIPAAEHSTITSWGRGAEALAYENMVKQFSKPGSIYAVVSDSYDIFNAVDNLWGEELRDLVVSSGGTLVIRPDSGDPLQVLPRLIASLSKKFGYTTNDKGYMVLKNVRLIWGDGINKLTIQSILRVLVDMMGWSADNIAFGMGGALLQIVNRDDLKFAMKCSAIGVREQYDSDDFDDYEELVWRDVFKDPVTDKGKTSLAGCFSVIRDGDDYKNIRVNMNSAALIPDDQLRLRYCDGVLYNQMVFDQVRSNQG